MPLKRTYTIFFISLLSAIVAVASLFLIFNLIQKKNEYLGGLMNKIQSKVDQKDNIQTLQKTVDETKEKESLLSSYLVNPNNIDEFISYLEKEGDSVSVPVDVVSVNAPLDTKNKLNIELKGLGSFENIMSLVTLIENSPYQIKVNHAYINKYIKPKDSPILINGKVFAEPPTKSSLFEINLAFSVVSTE